MNPKRLIALRSRRAWLLSLLPAMAVLKMAFMASPAEAADPFAGVRQVEVFANSAMVVTAPQGAPFSLNVYRVDGIAQAEAMANQGLPQNEQDARQFLATRHADLQRRVEPLVRNALQGLQLAQKYRLDRMPAVVINRQSVVFGVTDVTEALHRYQAHQQNAHLQSKGAR